MTWFIEIIGIIIFFVGLVFFIKPVLMRKMIKFYQKRKNIYIGSGVNIIIGIILIVNASRSMFQTAEFVGWSCFLV